MSESKIVISSTDAPKAIGPYSQAIKVGNLLFCSGQIPLDPQSMKVEATEIVGQTQQVLKNIEAVLLAAGTSWDKVVKTTVFMKDLTQFEAFNEIYAQYLKQKNVSSFPARSTVEVAKLPRSVLIEIEVLALA